MVSRMLLTALCHTGLRACCQAEAVQQCVFGYSLLTLESSNKVFPVNSDDHLGGKKSQRFENIDAESNVHDTSKEIGANNLSGNGQILTVEVAPSDEIDPTNSSDNTSDPDASKDGDVHNDIQDVEPKTNENGIVGRRRTTVGVADESFASVLETQMEAAVAAGKQLRFRMMMATVVFGGAMTVASSTFEHLIKSAVLSSGTFGSEVIYASMTFPFLSLMILGILPDDIVTIRAVSLFLVVICVLLGGLWTFESYSVWFVDRHEITGFDGDTTELKCGADLPELGCSISAAELLGDAILVFVVAFFLRRNLVKVENENFYDKTQAKGYRFNDSVFKVHARDALDSIWFYGRLACGLFSVSAIGVASLYSTLGDRAPWFSKDYLKAELIYGSINIVLCVFYTPARRRQIIGFITSFVVEDETMSAASVASLLGKTNAQDALLLAKTKFRSINFCHLTEEDFLNNQEDPDKERTLYDNTEITNLGDCDVFLSHSWHDNGSNKYEALQLWAEEFKTKEGRYPQVWLDKACIDQTNISDDLVCLPIFLAGCETLLIIAGHTYIERLWCMMEIFVFLSMGGSTQRITIIPIAAEGKHESRKQRMQEEKNVTLQFEKADVTKSHCYLEKDRERLLNIVQKGFGSFDAFNSIIHHVFRERITVQLTFEEWKSELEEVARQSKTLRFRLGLWTTGIGFVGLSAGLAMNHLVGQGVLDSRKFGPSAAYSSLIVPFGVFGGLGIMPNDAITIRLLSLFFTVALVALGMLDVWSSADLWFTQRTINRNDDSDSTIFPCGSDLPYAGCGTRAFSFLLGGVVAVFSGLPMFSNLRRSTNASVYDWKMAQGFRFKDHVFKTPARLALNNVWLYGRLWTLFTGVLYVVHGVALHELADRAPFFTDTDFFSWLITGISRPIIYLLTNHHYRRSATAFISSMHAHHQAMSAACVGALLGGHNITNSLKLAKEKFRCIHFEDLAPEDLKDSEEITGADETLFSKSSAIELGSCDVFISHSWHDDSKTKFEALKKWTAKFKQENNREPTFWFDKACVDQKNISIDLLCLPIFLSGCEILLVLAGPTYTERLWCIVEVFVFLKMGGSIDRITILPIEPATENDTKSLFEEIDVNTCKCSLENDRQRLLGVIEQAFGTKRTFNKIIRKIFKKKQNITTVRRRTVHIPRASTDTEVAPIKSQCITSSPALFPPSSQKYKPAQDTTTPSSPQTKHLN